MEEEDSLLKFFLTFVRRKLKNKFAGLPEDEKRDRSTVRDIKLNSSHVRFRFFSFLPSSFFFFLFVSYYRKKISSALRVTAKQKVLNVAFLLNNLKDNFE